MKSESPEGKQIKKDKAYWEARQNLFGFFSLLLEVDKRVNPHIYKKLKIKQQVIDAGGAGFHSEENRKLLHREAISHIVATPNESSGGASRLSDLQQKPAVPQKTNVEGRLSRARKAVNNYDR